jgi:hypothetical protein
MLRSYYAVKLSSSSQVGFSGIEGSSFALQHCIRLLSYPILSYFTVLATDTVSLFHLPPSLPHHYAFCVPWKRQG